MSLFPEHACILAGLSVFQTEEVDSVDISGLVTGQWGKYFGRGRPVSGGWGAENKAPEVRRKETFPRRPASRSREAVPALDPLMDCSALCRFLSSPPRFLSSISLSLSTGEESQPIQPGRVPGPLWEPRCWGGGNRGLTFCSQQHFGGLTPRERHLSLGVKRITSQMNILKLELAFLTCLPAAMIVLKSDIIYDTGS